MIFGGGSGTLTFDLTLVALHREGLLVATNIYGVPVPFIFLVKSYAALSQSMWITPLDLLYHTTRQAEIEQGR